MTYTCFKNWHWFLPILPRIYFFKRNWKWCVKFIEGWNYDLQGVDQYDWNKLCGVSNTWNPRKESLRVVWRYNIDYKIITVSVFLERNSVFESYLSIDLVKEKIANISFKKLGDKTKVTINDQSQVFDFKLNNISYKSMCYFGGNKTAPNKMKINIT